MRSANSISRRLAGALLLLVALSGLAAAPAPERSHDAPAELLAKRILQRRPVKQTDRVLERLEQLRIGLRSRAAQKDQGPVLFLDAEQLDWALAAVVAAAQAMR